MVIPLLLHPSARRSTYFFFDGIYYYQMDGTVMGSEVSSVVANLYMEDGEQISQQLMTLKPKKMAPLCRLDDLWVVWPNKSDALTTS